MALGAERRDVLSMVARDMTWPLAAGITVGVGVALASGRLLDGLLFGLAPRDVPTFAVGIAVLLASGAAAVWGPSRRASRIDPVVALRED
jgi:ABC-type antimicrobial peptide transport system permease subunit